MNQWLDKLSSLIINDVRSGLRGEHHNMSMSEELIQDEIINMRLQVIKEFQLKGILPMSDLMQSINCIPIDCKDIERCPACLKAGMGTPTMHFEIPQLLLDFGVTPINYIGSPDRQNPFIYYTSSLLWNYYHKYRRRGKNKPYVFVDITPNENGMLDCFVFNAPMMKSISVSAIFKDPRLLDEFGCCDNLNGENFSWINSEIANRITTLKIKYYRQLAAPILPNNQQYAAG